MARRRRNSLEHNEQVALFEWIRWMRNQDERFKCIYAVPNGFQGSPEAGQWMKDEGLEPGVPDICVAVPQIVGECQVAEKGVFPSPIYPVMRYPGLYIEMKAPYRKKEKSGGLEPSQREWLKILAAQGYKTAVCYSQDEARALICEYLGVRDSAITGDPDIWSRAEEGHNDMDTLSYAPAEDPVKFIKGLIEDEVQYIKSVALIPVDTGRWQVDIKMYGGGSYQLMDVPREVARDLFNKHRKAQRELLKNGV